MKIMSRGRKLDTLVLLWRLAAFVAALAALAHFVTYVYVAISRMPFPFTLEWMEGGSLVQVSRILSGKPLYVRPSFDFVPQIYPPLFFYLSALASKLLGSGFMPLRLVSFLSSLGILVLIGSMVRQQSGSIFSGLLAAGFFCATFALSGHWFDLARADSLALVLLLLAVFLLLKDDPISCALGGIFLALSCLTKQTLIFAGCVLAVYSVLPPRRNGLIFLGSALVVFIGATLALDWLHGGWYLYYTVQLPSRHSFITSTASFLVSFRDFLVGDIVTPIPLAVFFGLVYWFVFPRSARSLDGEARRDGSLCNGKWPRMYIWLLLVVTAVAATISILFLAVLPSDVEGRVLGRYSYARLGLLAGQVIIVGVVLALGVRLAKERSLSAKLSFLIFGDVRTVPRILLACTVLTFSSIVALSRFQPQVLERLLPYLAELVILTIVLCVSWWLIWGTPRLKTWLFILLAGGLMATSLLNRLNPGGYENALMPAYAGASILYGLGVGETQKTLAHHPSKCRRIIGILVLCLVSAQFITLLSPMAPQIPSVADTEAGLELVNRIRNCPADVYIPYHTYLSELAGKNGHAGWIEMDELTSETGQGPDPLWYEVSTQIKYALDSHTFAAIIQDREVFRAALSDEYKPVGTVFSNSRVFWPVTGWRLRPEVIYKAPGVEGCDLKIE
jgi:hypothetical protein